MSNSSKLIKNSMILYGRMVFSALIGLFSTRLVLLSLGVDDYGIYTLIIGVVGMMSVLNGAMGTSTQRFLSHTMGSGDHEKLKSIFATSQIIHLTLALSISVILAIIGNIIIKDFLNIPSERLNVATQIYYFVIISSFFSISTTPFDGNLVANENFLIIALAELMISSINLLSAIFIYYVNSDKLLIYALITTSGMVCISIFKQIYCSSKYQECSLFPKKIEKQYFWEITSFAGWNLFGALCSLARGQGLAVVMNIYFGVKVNAASGISGQVVGQLNTLSSVVTKAIYPQLMKAEGGGDREKMFRLSILTTKIPYILMAIIGIPIILEVDYILTLWLKDVPDYANELVILSIILSLVITLSSGLIAAVQSIGQIKIYQVVTGALIILGLPLTIIFFRNGFTVVWAVIVAIIIEIIAHFFRLGFIKKIAGLNVSAYLKEVDLKLIGITAVGLIFSYFVTLTLDQGIFRLTLVLFISITVILITTYTILMEKAEKKLVIELITRAKNRIMRNN